MKIADIRAREIFDSRGIPTIECELVLDNGYAVVASVPSGISRGMHEAVELRDGGDRLMGLGVQRCVTIIENIISPMLTGMEPHVVTIDSELLALDGTDDKSHLGANTILAVSIATCKAQAYQDGMTVYDLVASLIESEDIALPCPMFNLFGGGAHANNNSMIQEHLIVPVGASSFFDAIDIGAAVFHSTRELLQKKGKSTAVGYEGEFVPTFDNDIEAFDFAMEAIERAGVGPSSVMLAIDVAASQFYSTTTGMYHMRGKQLSAQDLIAWYVELANAYPLYSIEDGLRENDWDNWKNMKHALGGAVKLIGDDIFVTNPQRIWHGIENDVATGVLIKPNQIGTITETLQAVALCNDSDWDVIVSHRSGETNDSFIADFAVGVSATCLKAGGFARGERIAKYNRLLAIENEMLLYEEME